MKKGLFALLPILGVENMTLYYYHNRLEGYEPNFSSNTPVGVVGAGALGSRWLCYWQKTGPLSCARRQRL